MVKVISWNIAHREQAWRDLCNTDADIALVQEASEPPADMPPPFEYRPATWRTAGAGHRPWRAAVVKLSSRIDVEWLEPTPIEKAQAGDFTVSRAGTLDAAIVTPPTGDAFVVVSMYALWEKPYPTTRSSWIYADAAVHRLISDISVFVGQQSGHRILAAGDLNILHGYGDHKSGYWASRYATVFDRMRALGLSFVGPQAPAGRRADPWPDELPPTSHNVPTYRTHRQTPATATRQLDFVFASKGLAEQCQVSARNEPDAWGPSDHCQVHIVVASGGTNRADRFVQPADGVEVIKKMGGVKG